MFLWFCGLALVLMWNVFRDPAIDHRLVMVGAVLPPFVDLPFGGARFAHTLLGSVVLMGVVMAVTVGRRRLRRRLLALPIGTMFHLVLSGIWSSAEVFWWPALGLDFGDVAIPALDRPVGVAVVMELVGLAALVWAWVRFGLSDPARRAVFVRDGRIDRSLTDATEPPTC